MQNLGPFYVHGNIYNVDTRKDVVVDLDLAFTGPAGVIKAPMTATRNTFAVYESGLLDATPPETIQDGCETLVRLHEKVSLYVDPNRMGRRDEPSCCVSFLYGRTTKGGVSIHVTKVVPGSDKPVGNATVVVASANPFALDDMVRIEKRTDLCGDVNFYGLASGTYSIQVQQVENLSFGDPQDGNRIYSVCGGQIGKLTFSLKPAEPCTWLVLHDEQCNPWPNATVVLCEIGPDRAGQPVSYQTLGDGLVKIPLRAGPASISSLKAQDGTPLQVSRSTIQLGAGVVELVATRPQVFTLYGQVIGRNGSPLAHVPVELVDLTGAVREKTFTIEDGRYRLSSAVDPKGMSVRTPNKVVRVTPKSSPTEA
jgi:hypothetical protein